MSGSGKSRKTRSPSQPTTHLIPKPRHSERRGSFTDSLHHLFAPEDTITEQPKRSDSDSPGMENKHSPTEKRHSGGKGSAKGAGGKRASISSAISGINRRFSRAVQPELTGFLALDQAESFKIVPECLEGIDRAIGLYAFQNRCDFDPILFWVREFKGKTPHANIFAAAVYPKEGFVLKDLSKDPLMDEETTKMSVSLADGGFSLLHKHVAKIKNPMGATLFDFAKASVKDESEYLVYDRMRRRGSAGPEFCLKIEEKQRWPLMCAVCCGLNFYSTEFLVKQGEVIVAKIRPQLLNSSKSIAVEFSDEVRIETRMRPVVLGFALYLMMDIAYPEMKNLLAENMLRKKGSNG